MNVTPSQPSTSRRFRSRASTFRKRASNSGDAASAAARTSSFEGHGDTAPSGNAAQRPTCRGNGRPRSAPRALGQQQRNPRRIRGRAHRKERLSYMTSSPSPALSTTGRKGSDTKTTCPASEAMCCDSGSGMSASPAVTASGPASKSCSSHRRSSSTRCAARHSRRPVRGRLLKQTEVPMSTVLVAKGEIIRRDTNGWTSG